MSHDFSLLMEHLRKKTAEVELDVPSPQSSGDAATATRLAHARKDAIERGDRVARMYERGDGQRKQSPDGADRRPSLAVAVTENECRALLSAGATWVGPPAYTPMPRRFVERVRIRNFRCIKEVEFPLTPLHALIGPNDSGKSTILDAVKAISERSSHVGEVTAFLGERALTFFRSGLVEHQADVDPNDAVKQQQVQAPTPPLSELVGSVRVLRLDPDAMRQPTNLIAQGHPFEYTARGQGLSAVYDALLSRRLDVFLAISKRFTELFPTARSIQLTNPSQTTKALGVELSDGRSVGADGLAKACCTG